MSVPNEAEETTSDTTSQTASNPGSIFDRKEWNWLSNVIVITILVGVFLLVGLFLSFYFIRRWIRKTRAQRKANHQREKFINFLRKRQKSRAKQVLNEMTNEIYVNMKSKFKEEKCII